jgi:SAM-dependent methyltransferase
MLPASIAETRNRLAEKYLRGKGIEVGALDSPLLVPASAQVRYVDRVSASRLREYYPELGATPIVDPDVIDDGELLTTFAEGSLDFIVANHMLEHCENPIGTVRTHLSRLQPGGLLFYSVPDKRYSFDAQRDITTYDHLLRDALDHGASSRSRHYDEWATFVNGIADPVAAERNARENERNAYSIHFHVWDDRAFRQFLQDLITKSALAFTIEHFQSNDTEVIALLRKPA